MLSAPAAAAPQRVVSASLCADQYVLSVATRDQVAALSWQSRDAVSLAPDWARDLPQAAPDAERLLMLKPDLVVFGPGEGGPKTTRSGLSISRRSASG
ncbi:MAG: ABC transporter substrate-binding protein, partial [Euryhalocaulis sp.]